MTAESILGKCTVHTFDEYEKLEEVGPDVFFSRSKYNHVTEDYDKEESLPVYDKRFCYIVLIIYVRFFNNLRHCTC